MLGKNDEKGDGMSPRPQVGGQGWGEKAGLTPQAHENFSLSHKHSGIHGDGQKVKSASLDTVDPFVVNLEPTYVPVNAPTSGRRYRIQIVEVLDENNVLTPVIQLIAVP
jgi:hypothetical protein